MAEQGTKRRAQTIESMPLPMSVAVVQNNLLLHRFYSLREVAEWILGSARRFASLRPWMTKFERPGQSPTPRFY